jgi:hypothetical protein
MMNRYISGDNVHIGAVTNDGKEWGRESELAYTMQSGTLKNLNVKWRNSTIRRDFSTNEFDENRIFISYPISLSCKSRQTLFPCGSEHAREGGSVDSDTHTSRSLPQGHCKYATVVIEKRRLQRHLHQKSR